jgi:hypothetical protein
MTCDSDVIAEAAAAAAAAAAEALEEEVVDVEETEAAAAAAAESSASPESCSMPSSSADWHSPSSTKKAENEKKMVQVTSSAFVVDIYLSFPRIGNNRHNGHTSESRWPEVEN